MGRTKKNKPTEDEDFVYSCRNALKVNILHPKNTVLLGLDAEYTELYNLIARTVNLAESNSALIVGPRGSGKTSLLEKVLKSIKEESERFLDTLLVRLNGYMHTDDRLALKAITTQMKLENCIGNKVFGSFAENLTFLLHCLGVGSQKTSKSVIFILDEFDLFCNHRNQTLLYNLFDICQSAQAPICVLGLTCRNDVVELLEKRVLSRFSNRQIHIYPSADETEDETLQRRIKLMKRILSLKEKSPVAKEWNNSISKLCLNKTVVDCIRTLNEITHCERAFRNFLFLLVSKLNENHPALEPEDFTNVYEQMNHNTRVAIVEGLSVLELSLLISMKHHTEIYDGEPFNFERILSRYLKFAYEDIMSKFDRQVILKAFENLKRLELIQPVTAGNVQVSKEFQMFHLLVLSEEIKEAVCNSSHLPTDVTQWAMSDLT